MTRPPVLPSSMHKPWAGSDSYQISGLNTVHGWTASPVHSSSLPFCVRFNVALRGGTPYSHAATLDTGPVASGYPGGIRTRWSTNHFQSARATLGSASAGCSVHNSSNPRASATRPHFIRRTYHRAPKSRPRTNLAGTTASFAIRGSTFWVVHAGIVYPPIPPQPISPQCRARPEIPSREFTQHGDGRVGVFEKRFAVIGRARRISPDVPSESGVREKWGGRARDYSIWPNDQDQAAGTITRNHWQPTLPPLACILLVRRFARLCPKTAYVAWIFSSTHSRISSASPTPRDFAIARTALASSVCQMDRDLGVPFEDAFAHLFEFVLEFGDVMRVPEIGQFLDRIGLGKS